MIMKEDVDNNLSEIDIKRTKIKKNDDEGSYESQETNDDYNKSLPKEEPKSHRWWYFK